VAIEEKWKYLESVVFCECALKLNVKQEVEGENLMA